MEPGRFHRQHDRQGPEGRRREQARERRARRGCGGAMPHGQRIERREGECGLAEVEENRLGEALIAECRQRDGIGEVHGVDAADGKEKSALRRAGETQHSRERPGEEHQRERDEAGSQRQLPGRRGKGHAIQRDENRRRQRNGKDEEPQPFRMRFRRAGRTSARQRRRRRGSETLEGPEAWGRRVTETVARCSQAASSVVER